MNARRLAAVDMHGTAGTVRRRRLILAEFTAGTVVLFGFGAWIAVASSGVAGILVGVWMIAAGVNYAQLALSAIALSRPGVLDAELAGVDVRREIRRYSAWQLWLLVPFSLAVLTARDRLTSG